MALPLAIGIGAVLATIIVPLVVKVLLALGIGFVTYTGTNLLLDGILTEIQAQFVFTGFPQLLNLMAIWNVDRAITMIFSAVVIRATLRGLQAGGDLRRLSMAGG